MLAPLGPRLFGVAAGLLGAAFTGLPLVIAVTLFKSGMLVVPGSSHVGGRRVYRRDTPILYWSIFVAMWLTLLPLFILCIYIIISSWFLTTIANVSH